MKKSSENFWRASARKKRGSQIFRLRRPFFRCGGIKNLLSIGLYHTSSPNFFRGVLGRKWKSPRKIFGAPPARKKRGSQIFRLRRAFFVVEALKTVKKPLIFRNLFQKSSNFWKKGPQKFFACGGLFFKKVLGQKHTSPALWRGMP